MAEGANTSGLTKMRKIGASGKRDTNCARDFRRLVKRLPLGERIEPVEIDIMMKRGKTSFAPCKFPIICPHDVISAISSHDSTLFSKVFVGDRGREGLREFWQKSKECAWYQDHPYLELFEAMPEQCVPVKVFGDDGPMTKSQCLNIFQFSSVITKVATMLGRWLTFVFVIGTVFSCEDIFEVVAWSFEWLRIGKTPDQDHKKIPFPAGSTRAQQAGELIANGFKFILTWTVGDLKWLVECFEFQDNYNHDSMCHQCKATKSVGLLCGYNYSSEAGWRFAKRLHLIYMQSIGRDVAITKLPGVHIFGIKWDGMRILALGILQWALGAVFFELLQEDFWEATAGPWQQRYASQLVIAYRDFSHWCKSQGLDTSQRQFTLARLCLKTLSTSAPYFKGKAYNTICVAKWVSSLLHADAIAHPDDQHKQARAGCIWGYCEVVDVCRGAGLFLTDEQADEVSKGIQTSLLCHNFLASEAIAKGWLRWVSKPKHHYWQHLGLAAEKERINPCSHWVFQDEDFVGRIIKLAKSCHQLTLVTTVIDNYCLLLQALLHTWTDEFPFQELSEHESSDEAPDA